MIIKILLSSQNIQRFLKKLIVQTLNLYIEDMYVNQIVMHGDNVKIISDFFFSFEIASHITQESYGLVFGFNTFLALLFQTILTATVADSAGLALDIRTQVVDIYI